MADHPGRESRRVLLKFKESPAWRSSGLAHIATLELSYVERLRGDHSFAAISVNVVPGDEAAGRVLVDSPFYEVLFQEAQDAKRQASEAFERDEAARGKLALVSPGQADPVLGRRPRAAQAGDPRRAQRGRPHGRHRTGHGNRVHVKLSRDSYHRATTSVAAHPRTPEPRTASAGSSAADPFWADGGRPRLLADTAGRAPPLRLRPASGCRPAETQGQPCRSGQPEGMIMTGMR